LNVAQIVVGGRALVLFSIGDERGSTVQAIRDGVDELFCSR
jgi:hypothetical protein